MLNSREISDKLRIMSAKKDLFKSFYKKCSLCPGKCGVDRTSGERGLCSSGKDATVYTYGPHFGEEPVLSGTGGSGAVFFSNCVLKCLYCQNHKFSQEEQGERYPPEGLSDIFLRLQEKGCHNINLVNPTHYLPVITDALEIALRKGLKIPVIYNTGGFDSPALIEALEGIIDIFLPDMRYSSDRMAVKYSGVNKYVSTNRKGILYMRRKRPDIIKNGIMKSGLIIRLLVLPGGVSGTGDSIRYISRKIGKDTLISLMSQYYPAYKASDVPELSERPGAEEYKEIRKILRRLGLNRGWVQPYQVDFDEKLAGDNLTPFK